MSPRPGSPPLARAATLLLLFATGFAWAGWGIRAHHTPEVPSAGLAGSTALDLVAGKPHPLP